MSWPRQPRQRRWDNLVGRSQRYPSPRLEERLIIEIERDGEKVSWAQVALPPAPDPKAKPPRSADDETLQAGIEELLSHGGG